MGAPSSRAVARGEGADMICPLYLHHSHTEDGARRHGLRAPTGGDADGVPRELVKRHRRWRHGESRGGGLRRGRTRKQEFR